MIKIAINGLGRIGRIFLRQVLLDDVDFDVVAVNDLIDKENLFYLLKHDSVYGKFELPKDKIDKIKFFQEKDPVKLPWKDLGVDVAMEATGVFASYEKAKLHLDAGAKRVVITAPVPKEDPSTGSGQVITFNPNVGMGAIEKSKITSNASCTTNAVTPIATIMMQNPGIKKAILNTVHGYTATQNLVDGPNKKDYRRGRAAAVNIVPSSTGAAVATGKAIPALEGKFDGIAMRVPVISGSVIDFTFISEKPTSVEEINDIFRERCKELEWEGIIKIAEEPLTSTDILKEPYGSIVDLSMTQSG